MDEQATKTALAECLTHVFHPDGAVRSQAEFQLSQMLEAEPGCVLFLGELLVNDAAPLHVRQLAGVVLRQFLSVHWSSKLENFVAPEVPPPFKTALRALLPPKLADHERKIRTAVALAISTIGQYDWPEDWPGLVEELTAVLVNGTNESLLDGAATCLDLLVCGEGLTEASFPALASIVLPEEGLLSALKKTDLPGSSRARITSVFLSVLGWAITVKTKYPASRVLAPYLSAWMETFVHLLGLPEDLRGDYALKINVLKSLVLLFSAFPKEVSSYLSGVLMPLFKPLVECVDIYDQFVVSETTLDVIKDEEGDIMGFSPFLLLLLEMFHIFNEKPYYRKVLQPFVGELVHVCIAYMQITAEQMELWESDPNEFVAAEEDEAFHYSLRVSAIQLLQQLCTTFPREFLQVFKPAASGWLVQADALQAAAHPRWWRLREAVLLGVGSCVGLLGESPPDLFDLSTFVATVLHPDMRSTVPLLRGRALWCAAQLAHKVRPEESLPFVEAAVLCLQNRDENLQVKVCSCRAMASFAPKVPPEVLSACLEPTMRAVLGMLQQTSEDTLHLVLETLNVLLRINPLQTFRVAPEATCALVEVWAAHSIDLLITQDCVDALAGMCTVPDCAESLSSSLLPVLLGLLHDYLTTEEALKPQYSGRVEAALDLCSALLRGTSPTPPPTLINDVFPMCVAILRSADDHSVINAGTECLSAFAKGNAANLSSWTGEGGQTGLQLIVDVLDRLLQPDVPDTAAMQVGRLVTSLIQHCAGDLSAIIPQILQRTAMRLKLAVMDDLICSLTLVFARLIISSFDDVVPFLQELILPGGDNALHFIVATWTKNHQNFAGSLSIKVSMYGLTCLLAQANEDVLRVEVPGELIPPEGRTRRSARLAGQSAERWTSVPLVVKILSLIVQELQVMEEVATADEIEKQFFDFDGEDGLELTALALDEGFEAAGTYLDSFIGDTIDEDEEEDHDARNDPLFSLDLQQHLIGFLKSLGTDNPSLLRASAEQLAPLEQKYLLQILRPE